MKKRIIFKKGIAATLALSMFLMGPAAQAAGVAQGLQEEYATPGDAEVYESEQTVQNEVASTEADNMVAEESTTEAEMPELENVAPATETDAEDVDDTAILAGDSFANATLVSDGAGSVDIVNGQRAYFKYVAPSEGFLYVATYSTSPYAGYTYIYDANQTQINGYDVSHCQRTSLVNVKKGETYYIIFNFIGGRETGNLPYEIDFTPITKNGWMQVLDVWYYIQNGQPVVSTWKKFGDYWYYFDERGIDQVDKSCKIYDNKTMRYCYYWFDENGHMITGWKKQNDSWVYCYPSGIAAEGIVTIGADTYLFSEGYMRADYKYSDREYIYYFGTDGKMVTKTPKKDGWIKLGTEWYYFLNGYALSNTLYEIGNATYCFDYYGHMKKDCFEAANGGARYFDSNGKMVTGWKYINFNWHYFNEDGLSHKVGKDIIDGKTYYFTNMGRLVCDYEYREGSTRSYFGRDGELEEQVTFTDGWNTYRGNKYYQRNGKLLSRTTAEIDGYYYAFNTDATMVHDAAYGNARYDSNGHRMSGWVLSDSGTWYYYDETGNSLTGLQVIKGKTYYFLGGLCMDYVYADNACAYYFDQNGELAETKTFKNGWNSFRGDWFYVDNGTLCKNVIKEIGGKTYGFDWYGVMVTGLHSFGGVRRYFDKNGCMVTGWVQSETGDYYYFDENGKGVSGLQTIAGKQYRFNAVGALAVNETYRAGDYFYISDEKGYVTEVQAGWDGDSYVEHGNYTVGWKKIDGAWYYFATSSREKCTGKQVIDGKAYFFDSFGRMCRGWIATGDGYVYAGSDGVLIGDGWQTINNKTYYFENGFAVKGMHRIGYEVHYFNPDCEWVQQITGKARWMKLDGDYYYCSYDSFANGYWPVDGKVYYFNQCGQCLGDDLGYLDSNKYKNCWVEKYAGVWEYYDEEGNLLQEKWARINGKWYYFDRSHEMVTGDYVIKGVIYHFDKNGVWDGTSKTTGWVNMENEYYYLRDGKCVDGRQEINGQIYYFSNKALLHDTVWYDGTVIGKDGKTVKNAWCKIDEGGYVYAGADGKSARGLQTIGGKQYYFADEGLYYETYIMQTNNIMSEDAKSFYEINSNGVVTKTVKADKNGWYKASNGDYVYVRNGKFVTGYQMISNVGYYFEKGLMVKNTVIPGYGYFGADGAFVSANGWQKINGNWQYLCDGKAMTGPVVIKGKEYYLTPDNFTGTICIDNVCYYYDGNGNKKTVSNTDGWKKMGDDWFYFVEGKPLSSEHTINGATYLFEDGRMMTDCFISYGKWLDDICIDVCHYYGKDGKLVTNSWIDFNGLRFYAGANGNLVRGVQTIDGVKYNFSSQGVCLSK